MGRVKQVAAFTAGLYRTRAVTAYHGYVRNEPMAQLMLRPAQQNPYAIYDRLRADGPMATTPLGTIVTTSHSICSRVLRERSFGVRPEGEQPGESDLGLSFLECDPPDHTRLRRLAAPAFRPRELARYAPRIDDCVHRLLDDLPADGSFDLVTAFAGALPIAVISELLGVPNTHADEFSHYGATIGSALDGVKSLRHARALMQARTALERIFTELFELRRREPADDVISTLVAAEDGQQMTAAEMLPMCTLLLIAGFETTVNLISNGVLALLDNPEQWAALRADPGVAARTTEEVLRYDSPVQRTSRVALADTELGGTPIRRGQYIVTLIGAANRDPAVYEQADRFDIMRNAAEHLSFSAGLHYCLGAPLARMEATAAFAALAERLPGLRRSGRVVRRNAATIRGPLRLPVTR